MKIISDTTALIILAKSNHLNLFTNIIDEKTGRKVAKQKGVKIIGLLGILEANFRLGFISYRELFYILEDFKRVDYRLSSTLERAFLEELGE